MADCLLRLVAIWNSSGMNLRESVKLHHLQSFLPRLDEVRIQLTSPNVGTSLDAQE